MHFFRDFITGVSNLIYYFPVIWQDRQWDYGFVLHILERKLARQHRHLSDPAKNMAVHNAKELRRLQTARLLAKRLVDCVHCDLAGHEELERKYPQTLSQWMDDLQNPSQTPEAKARRAASYRWALHSTYLENQDWDLLWDTIKNYGRRWWD